MTTAPAPAATRANAARALATIAGIAVALAGVARPAAAQGATGCPAGAVCTFGTDETGSSTTRAANVQSLAAHDQFLRGLPGASTQGFDALADGTPLPLTVSFAGAGTATVGGSGNVAAELVDPKLGRVPDDGRYAVSGSQYLFAIAPTVTSPSGVPAFTLDFARPVAAFGFYASDVGEFGSQLALRFALVGGGFATWALPYAATNGTDTRRDGSLLYAGFVSPVDFTSVTFLGTGADDDNIALDDLTVGARAQLAAVPEPATAALLAAGVLPLALAARRRARPRA